MCTMSDYQSNIWLDSVIFTVREKISNVLQIWRDIGITEDLYDQRKEVLSCHIFGLLEAMLNEEYNVKDNLYKSIDRLEIKLAKLNEDLGLKHESCYKNLPLLERERALSEINKNVLKKASDYFYQYQKLNSEQERICSRLGELYVKITFNHVPSISMLDSLRNIVQQLKLEEKSRLSQYEYLKSNMLEMASSLGHFLTEDDLKMCCLLLKKTNSDSAPLNTIYLNNLKQHNNELKQKMSVAEKEYARNMSTIKDIQSRLHVDVVDTCDMCNGLLCDTLEKTRKALLKLEVIRQENVSKLTSACFEELNRWFELCFVDNCTRNKFSTTTNPITSDDSLKTLEREIEHWKNYYDIHHDLLSAFRNWQLAFTRMIEIQHLMNDPANLKNRGGVLLKLKREYNTLTQRNLPRHETTLNELTKMRGKEYCCVFGMPAIDYIKKTWKNIDEEKENSIKRHRDVNADLNRPGIFNKIQTPESRRKCVINTPLSLHWNSALNVSQFSGTPSARVSAKSRMVVKTANRLDLTNSLCTPRSVYYGSSRVGTSGLLAASCSRITSLSCKNSIETISSKNYSILSVKDLFLRPTDPVSTPMRMIRKPPSTPTTRLQFATPRGRPKTVGRKSKVFGCHTLKAPATTTAIPTYKNTDSRAIKNHKENCLLSNAFLNSVNISTTTPTLSVKHLFNRPLTSTCDISATSSTPH